MSSTRRNSPIRLADDHYVTPAPHTRAILPYLVRADGSAPRTIFEPMAGEGAIVREVRAFWPEAKIIANELDGSRSCKLIGAGADASHCADLFNPERPWLDSSLIAPERRFDLCIGNPAYSYAIETIEEVLPYVDQLALLLRFNFRGTGGRKAFFQKTHPDMYLCDQRPEFAASLKCRPKAGSGHRSCGWEIIQAIELPRPRMCPACKVCETSCSTTDSGESAWFVWSAGRIGRVYDLDINKSKKHRAPRPEAAILSPASNP